MSVNSMEDAIFLPHLTDNTVFRRKTPFSSKIVLYYFAARNATGQMKKVLSLVPHELWRVWEVFVDFCVGQFRQKGADTLYDQIEVLSAPFGGGVGGVADCAVVV